VIIQIYPKICVQGGIEWECLVVCIFNF